MKELLVELGTEELPPSYILPGVRQLAEGLVRALDEARVSHGEPRLFATPRRLAVLLEVAQRGEDAEEEVLGPPERAGERAKEGFARKLGLSPESLFVKETPKGRYWAAKLVKPGRDVREVMAEALPRVIREMRFKKTMTWGAGLRFPRPIRWLVVILDGEVIPVKLGNLEAGRRTKGHPLLSPGWLELGRAGDYERELEKRGVVPSWERRRQKLWQALESAAKPFSVQEDPELLEEVVGLLEHPAAVRGSFPERFLDLPEEVIIQAMKAHQRYFALRREDGRLAPAFAAGVDNEPNPEIVKGLERVLVARLEDAAFYFKEDLKKPLSAYREDLKGVKWGPWTAFDKSERVKALAVKLAKEWGASASVVARAAELYLAELATSMIRDGKEFTALEGTVGKDYALRSGEPPAVAIVIEEARLPRRLGDKLPESLEGATLAVADRLDTVLGAFVTGYKLSPTKDPLGVRRAMYAVIEIALNHGLGGNWRKFLEWAAEPFGGKGLEEAWELLRTRLENYLQEREGIRYDIVDACLVSPDIVDVAARARALWRAFKEEPEVFQGVAVGQKRLANILEGVSPGEPDPALFEKEPEGALYEKARQVKPALEDAVSQGRYYEAVKILLELKPLIDRYFDEVFVMVDDEKLRRNRLATLSFVRKLFLKLADFSKIVVEGGQ